MASHDAMGFPYHRYASRATQWLHQSVVLQKGHGCKYEPACIDGADTRHMPYTGAGCPITCERGSGPGRRSVKSWYLQLDQVLNIGLHFGDAAHPSGVKRLSATPYAPTSLVARNIAHEGCHPVDRAVLRALKLRPKNSRRVAHLSHRLSPCLGAIARYEIGAAP